MWRQLKMFVRQDTEGWGIQGRDKVQGTRDKVQGHILKNKAPTVFQIDACFPNHLL